MKEKEYFQALIRERAVDDATVRARACAPVPCKGLAWRRAAAIAGLCAAALIATVFAIPTARAEVLGWFTKVSRPEEYLTAPKDERPSLPELDTLITSPEDVKTDLEVIPIERTPTAVIENTTPDRVRTEFEAMPIDRAASAAINSEGALKISEFLYENCDISLGDAMFDGVFLYQAIHFEGLSGLYLLEPWVLGFETALEVDPKALSGTYDPADGPNWVTIGDEQHFYTRPYGKAYLELADGTRIGGFVDLTDAGISPYRSYLKENGIRDSLTEEQVQWLEAENRRYLTEHGLDAVMTAYSMDWEPYADADGNLTATVYYVVDILEEDRGDGRYIPNTELFKAKLGTVTVSMYACRDLEKRWFAPVEKAVAWGAETLTVGKVTLDHNGSYAYADDTVSLAKYRVSADGVVFTPTPGTVSVDALGIQAPHIRIKLPDAWTDAERAAFADSIRFKVLINGQSGSWFPQGTDCVVEKDGSALWTSSAIDNVPYDLLKSVEELTFIPVLRVCESADVYDANRDFLCTLAPDFGEEQTSPPNVLEWRSSETDTEYPEYAIVLRIK